MQAIIIQTLLIGIIVFHFWLVEAESINFTKYTNNHCGYRNLNGIGAAVYNIKERNETFFGEFPWTLYILRNATYLCGGSLIAPNVVITAAAHVQNTAAQILLVRAGDWNRETTDELLQHQDRSVREIIVHDQYNDDTADNNIALLILEKDFVLGANVQTICLPTGNKQLHMERTNCFATGWGKWRPNGDYAQIQKKIQMSIVSRGKCGRNFRKYLGRRFRLHESVICAGGGPNNDTCVGDGGAPLVCPIANAENRYVQRGMVSWGTCECGVKNVPGVYTSLAYMMPWIRAILKERNVNEDYFTVHSDFETN